MYNTLLYLNKWFTGVPLVAYFQELLKEGASTTTTGKGIMVVASLENC